MPPRRRPLRHTRTRSPVPGRLAVLAALTAALVLSAACGSPETEERPSVVEEVLPSDAQRVVLVSIDTLRGDRLGSSVGGQPVTPRLDALAEAGARFTNAISPVPITLPSHTTLLTGLEPLRHGVRANAIFALGEGIPTLATQLQAQGFATGAVIGAIVLDRQYGLARGFDVYDDAMPLRRSLGDGGFAERRADQVVDAALDWLDEQGDRFFLWVHMYDPHQKHDAPQRHRDIFPSDGYAAEIHFSDAQVGRLIDGVYERYPDGRTLFVVTSDHGEAFGEHGEPSHSYTLYDATQRVPLLIAGPGIPAGITVPDVAGLSDVAPTILDALGVAPEAETDGRSLLPQIHGEPAAEGDFAWVETIATRLEYGWSPLYGVRTDRFKYVRAPRPELYAVQDDPDELRDLAQTLPEVVSELDAVVEAELSAAKPLRTTLAPDPAQRARLESLGYVIPRAEDVDETATQVGGVDPKDVVGQLKRLARALDLQEEGKYAEALAEVEAIESDGGQIFTFRARYARLAGELALAERYARSALERNPAWAENHLELALTLVERGQLEEARELLQEAHRLSPAESRPLQILAVLEIRRRDFAAATELLERAYETRERNAEVTWRLAAMRLLEDRPEEAEALLAELPPWIQNHPEVVQNLVAGDRMAGHPERARARLHRAMRARPREPLFPEMLAEVEAEIVAAENAEEATPDGEANDGSGAS
jgi:arylsulfatase A-like enzyme/Flp pilus assembly protein TadD